MTTKVVLVHGLNGDLVKTWGDFPELLENDSDIDVKVVRYGYGFFYSPFIGSNESLHNIADGLASEIELRCSPDDDIILVGHSLGGLIIRKYLLNQYFKGNKLNVRKICFFAVPQNGSGLSNIARLIGWRHQQLKALCKDNKYLEEMNDQWISTKIANNYEILSVIGGRDNIVTAESSKSIFRDSEVKTLVGRGHVNIVKPEGSEDLSYLALKAFIKKKKTVTKYSNKASVSYQEWRRHDRKHNFDFISDKKRLENFEALSDALNSENPIVRLTGLSGLGKSRLIIEYLTREKISENEVIVFDSSIHSEEIKRTLSLALKEKAAGLVVIENCSAELHNYLTREVDANAAPLKIVSVNFYHDNIEKSAHVKIEKLDSTAIKNLISPMLPHLEEHDLNKIENFVEGFPLLAVLIAERYREDGVLSGDVSDREFVEKLINADNGLGAEERRVLEACSLFDVFGIELEGIHEADFIINLAESSRTVFGQVVRKFSDRQIMNRVGQYARVVPKPLAVQLAMSWWDDRLHESLTELINTLPESLIGSFCNQIRFLDSSEKVNQFVEKLCDKCSPFGQAELLMTSKGSRLFRALVEVNPKATSELIYRIVSEFTDKEVSEIDGDVRRNLVWALEMLSCHKSYFDTSSWCLFKLAQFENENFSNNATGEFAQLFRWQLSGTEADFEQRLKVLKRAVSLDVESSDLVVIEAIKASISTYGGFRTIGAEYQGTKAPIVEWRPQKWSEIYDYWQTMFDILLKLAEKDELIDIVKDAIGHEIRGLVGIDCLEMLDKVINSIIERTGKYWPAASQSITNSLHYDNESLPEVVKEALLKWEKLLSPDENNIEELLKLVVFDSSREHEKDVDGRYIDIAAEEAIELATRIAHELDRLYPYFDLILTFSEQKHSWVFARELVIKSDKGDALLNDLLDRAKQVPNVRFEFIAGLLVGLFQKDEARWIEILSRFSCEKELRQFYARAICTGKFSLKHLQELIQLIKRDSIEIYTVRSLNYGRATEHLTETEIVWYCNELSLIDAAGVWAALDTLNMYTFGRNDFDFEIIRPLLKKLLVSVSFVKSDKIKHTDGYHWRKSVEKLLITENGEFAITLSSHLIEQIANSDVDYSDLWDNLHPAMYKAFELHGKEIWPVMNPLLLSNKGVRKYRLIDLLGSGKQSRRKMRSIFELLDESTVIEWCRSEEALLIVADSLQMFKENEMGKTPSKLLVSLVEEYGDNKEFLRRILSNFHSRSWTGSIVPYLESDKRALLTESKNKNLLVRNWVSEFVSTLDKDIERESKREAESQLRRGY